MSKRSPHITPAGYSALQQELRALWSRRKDVVAALSAAAAEGDRSENAEYIYRKKELREVDRRIRYLDKRIPELRVVDTKPSDPGRVFFGAWVELCDEADNLHTYRIVGADEADARTAAISMDSPLAKALLRKSVDDEVEVKTGETSTLYTVVSVRYDDC